MRNLSIFILILLAGLVVYYFANNRENLDISLPMELQPEHNPQLATDNNNSMNLEDASIYEVDSSMVEYYNGVEGYYVRPSDEEDYPGVVMIHEWWGLNDNIKDMAEKLAGLGYQVLAVDLYNGQVATESGQARELVSSVNQAEATNNLQAAVYYLKNNNASKIASMGWCFGGGQSLQLAVSGQELEATVIYYGSLIEDKDKLSNIKWPVLGIFGSEDGSIPVESVNNFKTALDQLNVDNDINIYQGVGHAFANPSGPNYSPTETQDAWSKTVEFLQANLK